MLERPIIGHSQPSPGHHAPATQGYIYSQARTLVHPPMIVDHIRFFTVMHGPLIPNRLLLSRFTRLSKVSPLPAPPKHCQHPLKDPSLEQA
ncbi:hypothetical protein JB92DRAFT_2960016 [Gautieria morchelliformis]|nr:hypothetical protein JB92DRAFT_2960016 [Gautieria morchelliformis]